MTAAARKRPAEPAPTPPRGALPRVKLTRKQREAGRIVLEWLAEGRPPITEAEREAIRREWRGD